MSSVETEVKDGSKVSKCVCSFAENGSPYANHICGKRYSSSADNWCKNKLEDRSPCGHDKACHAKAKSHD